MQISDTPRRLTYLRSRSFRPVFGPDGVRVAFTRSGNGRSDIYIVNIDGSDLRCLTAGTGENFSPSFSPDGTRIVFVRDPDGHQERHDSYVTDLVSGEQRQLTHTKQETEPQFSPDGSRILFQSFRDGSSEIYRMNDDGSAQTRLTHSERPPDRRGRDSFGVRNLHPVFARTGGRSPSARRGTSRVITVSRFT